MDTHKIVNTARDLISDKLKAGGIQYILSENPTPLPNSIFDGVQRFEFQAIKLVGDEQFVFSRAVPIDKIHSLGANKLAEHLWDDVLAALARAKEK